MAIKIRNGSGNWDVAGVINVYNGGGWSAAKGFVFNGGSWVQFHPGVQLQTYQSDSEIYAYADGGFGIGTGGFSGSQIIFQNNGTVQYSLFNSNIGTYNIVTYNWLLPNNTASDYYVLFTTYYNAGGLSGSATNALVSLADTVSWAYVVPGPSSGYCPNEGSAGGLLSITNATAKTLVSLPITMGGIATNDTVC